jgi:methylated-DNA-protein-cysteine methyltransferase related protein
MPKSKKIEKTSLAERAVRQKRLVLPFRRETSVTSMVTGFALSRQKISAMILQVPKGQVASYAQIGEAAGFVRSARLVARVLRDPGMELPWWRIVRADGSCAVAGQLARLKSEGIIVKNVRIDMRRYRWQHMDYLLFGMSDATTD